MTFIVAATFAGAVAIVGYALAQALISIGRRYEENYLNKAGTELEAIHASVDARVVLQASLAAALFCILVVYMMTRSILPSVVLGAAGAVMPLGYLRFLRGRRQVQFHEQLPDMIAQTRTAVACGYTLPMALQLAQRQMPSPTGQELKVLLGQMRLGMPLSEALSRLQRRMPSDDLDLFVGAILMAERAGGQLSVILTNIEQSVRERLRLEKKFKTMTSRGRMEAWIITLAPVLLFLGLLTLNRNLMVDALETPAGIPVMILCGIWMFVGYLFIRKILTPEF